MSQPFISIVIPTRNRADYLGHALQSALEQTFDDYEVVVSNNDSTDRTAEVVAELSNHRVRYIETGKTLAMPDSWEFAVSHARGEFVTVLCDDDALAPRCCERGAKHLRESGVELLYWRRYHYTMSDWVEPERRNSVRLRKTTGRAVLEPTRPLLESWYRQPRYILHAPMLFNGFFPRRKIEAIRAAAGRFFVAPAPDVGASVMMLAHTDKMLLLDEAMGIVGSGRQSIGASQRHGAETGVAEAFEAEFKGDIFTHVPFRLNMITTTISDTLLKAKELLPAPLAPYELDWTSFYLQCHRELIGRRDRGLDVRGSLAELEGLMEAQEAGLLARAVREDRSRRRRAFRKRLIPSIRFRPRRRRVVRGADAGFSNILECARQLDRLVDELA